MRSETATAPTMTVLPQGDLFTSIETEKTIMETIQQLYTAGQPAIGLVAIHVCYSTSEKDERARHYTENRAEQGTLYLLQNLRLLVRKTDRVFLHDSTMYFVLLAANLPGAEIVEERLWDALLWRIHSMVEQELPRPISVSIGHSAFPQPQISVEELLHAAHATRKHFGERVQRAWQRNTRSLSAEERTQTEELPSLARKLGIPYLTFLPSRPPQRLLQVVSARLAQELRCYPVGRERNMLTVAMLNPQDHQALERLRQETGLLIFPVLTHPEALESALKQLG